ncbi:hypothetical protein VSU01S_09930 [Vibrio superstes NBRC 103154]|uniref:Uncharacterized protein n=1 Tax=Vibrio superstes NBRC 103154 TaxID=1219062 RepID=A0A511QN44_9VIBR|nr:hypothetical protein VSU01S_09930 [Vibrio superstes NBRC 103154]
MVVKLKRLLSDLSWTECNYTYAHLIFLAIALFAQAFTTYTEEHSAVAVRQNPKHRDAYKPWSSHDDQLIMTMHSEGTCIPDTM